MQATKNADLHCHSKFSDGALPPAELVRRAQRNGVEIFALTDHDHLGGLPEAALEAARLGLQFIPGVEISVSWLDQTIHVVGLGIDPDNRELQAGLAQVRSGRDARAREMSAALEKVGVKDAYAGAMRYVANPALIGRSHFARYLVECGYAKTPGEVFAHYLVPGKPGFVEQTWARLDEALGWIAGAGGLAVLAHPGRYRLSNAQLEEFLVAFKAGGGVGIEVCTGAHDEAATRRFATVARRYGFLASRASDFHAPGESETDLGGAPELPPDLEPVWARLT